MRIHLLLLDLLNSTCYVIVRDSPMSPTVFTKGKVKNEKWGSKCEGLRGQYSFVGRTAFVGDTTKRRLRRNWISMERFVEKIRSTSI